MFCFLIWCFPMSFLASFVSGSMSHMAQLMAAAQQNSGGSKAAPIGGRRLSVGERAPVGNVGKAQSQRTNQTNSNEEKSAGTNITGLPPGVVEAYIVQRYISNPLLLGGKKFDLRIYVLVPSYSPLTVWVYREGFARLSMSRYSNSKSSMTNNAVHLTNVAVQKVSPGYDASHGGKYDLNELKSFLVSRFGGSRVDKALFDIESLIIVSLKAVEAKVAPDRHSFELYGYDVMLDAELKPWLLEVNASPSLTANTKNDYRMKFNMLDDAFNVLNTEEVIPRDKYPDLRRIGGFDLLYRSDLGRILEPANSVMRSRLGRYNDRRECLRDLAMELAAAYQPTR